MWTTLKQAYVVVGRERRWRWVLLLVLALIVSGLEMLGAVIVYALLALVADPGGAVDLPVVGDPRRSFPTVDDEAFLLGTVAIMAVFFLLRAAVKVFAKYAQARLANNAGARLSTRMLEGYLLWPYEWHTSRTTAELIRNGHTVVQELVKNVLLPVIQLMAALVVVLGLLTVLFALAPLATLGAALVIGGAAAIVLIIVQPRIKHYGRVNHDESKTTYRVIQESLFGIRDVKVLGRERFFAREYGRSRSRMARAAYLRSALSQVPPIVIEMALLGFVLGYFAWTLVRGGAAQETLAVLGLFAYAGLRLQPPIQQIMSGLNDLKYSAAPLEDLYADLRSMDDAERPNKPAEPLPLRHSLDLEGVSFRYDGAARDALRGIHAHIKPGEQIGICGPTGGGKTTLVDVITGLLVPSAGHVTIDGVDLRGRERNWHANLGIVPQMVFLTNGTLRENIALGVPPSQVDDEAVAEALHLAQLDEFVASLPLGLDTKVGERGVRVSGGQRQRVAIARALYRRPEVLIFDEGTSALDNATEALMMRSIEGLRGDHTIILVAHRLSTVKGCDRILFLEDGQLTGVGTYEELLLTNDAFRTMASTG